MDFMFFDLEDGRPIAIRKEAIAAVFPMDKEDNGYSVILTIGSENSYFTVIKENYKNVISRLEWGIKERKIWKETME